MAKDLAAAAVAKAKAEQDAREITSKAQHAAKEQAAIEQLAMSIAEEVKAEEDLYLFQEIAAREWRKKAEREAAEKERLDAGAAAAQAMLTVHKIPASGDHGSSGGGGGGGGGGGSTASGPPKGSSSSDGSNGGGSTKYILMASMLGLVGTAYQMEQSESFAQSVESTVHPHFCIFVLTPLRELLRSSGLFESSEAKAIRLANQQQILGVAQESQRLKDEVAVAAAAVRAKRAGT